MGWWTIGLKLFPLIVTAIKKVEETVTDKGKSKQDIAIELIRTALEVQEYGEDGIGGTLSPEVETATRDCIDASVTLMNILSKREGEG